MTEPIHQIANHFSNSAPKLWTLEDFAFLTGRIRLPFSAKSALYRFPIALASMWT